MNSFKNLKDISKTQVLATGMTLNNMLNKDFLEELKSKLGEGYENIVTADIKIMLLPKPKEPKIEKGKKEVVIQLTSADFIRFEQPSPDHYKDKVVVITSNRKGNIDKILK